MNIKIIGIILIVFGLSYLIEPLYKIWCNDDIGFNEKFVNENRLGFNVKRYDRTVSCRIEGDSSCKELLIMTNMNDIRIVGGSVSLVSFEIKNISDSGWYGYSSYKIYPGKVSLYLDKVQCFCFNGLRIDSNTSCRLPILLYLDSSFISDPWMSDVDYITLSYSFNKF